MRGALKVDAFARRVVRDEDAHFGDLVEGDDTCSSRVARHAAVNYRDSLGFADGLPYIVRKIDEGVARLGEDDELASLPSPLVNDRRVVEDFRKLPPFGVFAR